MYIFDSDFLIEHLRGSETTSKVFEEILKSPSNHMFTTSISIYEMSRGCLKSKNYEKNFVQFQKLKRILHILSLDEQSALISAEIYHDLEKKGQLINESDILIAGICLKNNFTLVTNNKKHFSKIKGLRVL